MIRRLNSVYCDANSVTDSHSAVAAIGIDSPVWMATSLAETGMALQVARHDLAEAEAELARRGSFAEALLETLDVAIVSCDAAGLNWVRNRAQAASFGVSWSPAELPHDETVGLTDVFDVHGQRKLAEARAFFEAVLATTPDHTFVTHLATGMVTFGSDGQQVLGLSRNSLRALGSQLIVSVVHPEDQQRLSAANRDGADLADGEVMQSRLRARHADGSWRWLDRRVTPLRRDRSGRVSDVLGIMRDITDSVVAEQQLVDRALHDSLTGLANRALLIDRLDSALVRSEHGGHEVAVLCCDLDGFKRVNDTGGHAAGDAVLVEVARRVCGLVSDADTVARVSGDEFVVVVEPGNRAVALAEQVGAALRQPIEVCGVEHVVTASIGLTYATRSDLAAVTEPDGKVRVGGAAGLLHTAEAVLQDADAAMCRAKRLGKDRCEFFEHDLRTDRVESGRIEHVLRQALHHTSRAAPVRGIVIATEPTARLSADYQPIFDSDTGALVGFEALARLADADGRKIPPDVFIAVAEETGTIYALGAIMLDLACAQLREWRGQIPGLERVTMAVNVSALQAQNSSLGEQVGRVLQAHRLRPEDVMLELTETSLLHAGPSTIATLRALRADGVQIAIDDFGIGYSSLRYLATLPISVIKIDRSFTAGLPHDETSRKIVKAVAGLAAELDLGCIVEGVETTQQRGALPGGVHLQGWLTGRAEPPASLDVRALIENGA